MSDTIQREILQTLRGRSYTRASGTIADDATLNLVTAATITAAQKMQIWKIWIGASNAHATEVGTITIQDTAGVVLAAVKIGFASCVNGFVDLEAFELPANTGVDVVAASGTVAGTAVIYYRPLPA